MTPEELRERAEEILSREQFAEPEPSYFERALDWVFERIGRLIEEILGALGLGGVGGGLAWIILAVLLVVLLVVVVRAIRRWEAAGPEDEHGVSVSSAQRRTAEEWRAEAARHEAEGNWDEAVRCHHRAAVVDVAVRLGRADEPGSTAGRWRERAAASGVADLDDLTTLFDDVWYGDADADADAARRASRSPFRSSGAGAGTSESSR